MTKRSLEIGPGKRSLGPGWLTLNAVGSPDIKRRAEDTPYPIEDGSIDLLYASHVLEHVAWFQTDQVLREWHRILSPGGTAEILVPDFEKIVAVYRDPWLVRRDPWRRHNPNLDAFRWINGRLFNYAGHPDHPPEDGEDPNWHRATFDEWHLVQYLEAAGFSKVVQLHSARGGGRIHGRVEGSLGWMELGVKAIK